jgi:hypothetical protein
LPFASSTGTDYVSWRCRADPSLQHLQIMMHTLHLRKLALATILVLALAAHAAPVPGEDAGLPYRTELRAPQAPAGPAC